MCCCNTCNNFVISSRFKTLTYRAETLNFQGNAKLEKAPKIGKLKYSDSGVYECVVSMGGLKKTQTFELTVEGEFAVLFILVLFNLL